MREQPRWTFLLCLLSLTIASALDLAGWRSLSVAAGAVAGGMFVRGVNVLRANASRHATPAGGRIPVLARYVVCLVFPSQSGDAFLGDLEERFWRIYADKDFGAKYARFWYCFQVLISLRPIAFVLFKRLSGFAAAYELIRRVTR
jgi:hypothetical protein